MPVLLVTGIVLRRCSADLNTSTKDLPETHGIVRPAVYFTDHPFRHSRSTVSVTTSSASNDGS